MTGTIKIYMGCMFSGKTTQLIREYKKWKSIGKKILVLNHIWDNRYTNENYLCNHDKEKIECVLVDKLGDVDNDIKKYDIILINEGQFFSDLKEYCLKWCEQDHKNVNIYGLDGDHKREKFGQILDLIPYADEYIKLSAMCHKCKDGTIANFTYRINKNAEQVLIGSDQYLALCRAHYLGIT
jgi:thymidine kinase